MNQAIHDIPTNTATSAAAAKSPLQPQREFVTALDRQFVATGLESFQSDVPTSPQAQRQEYPTMVEQQKITPPVMDIDEESQHQPVSGASSMSPLSASINNENSVASNQSPAVFNNNQMSYNNPTSINYQSYSELSWDHTTDISSGSNILNDSTHHMKNTRLSVTSNISSVGMTSPRMEMDITDLETPRAGMQRKTVDVMRHGTPQGGTTPMIKNSMQNRQNGTGDSMTSSDPFYSLRIPSTTAMGMTPPRPMNAFNNPFGSAAPQFALPDGRGQGEAIPLLPKLEPTAA